MSFFPAFKKGDWTFIGVVSVLYYLLIRQYVQIVEDTYYSLVHPEYNRRVLSLWDAMSSQIYDYLNINGRYLVHTFTQYMCGSVYGREIYYICSTLFFSFLIIGMIVLLRRKYESAPIDKYLVLASLFFLMPVVGRVFLGHVSHVVNYLWSSALWVWFIIIYTYLREQNHCSILKMILIFFGGLIFGSWQESFTIPVAVYLFGYHLYHYKDLFKLNRGLYALLVGFSIGICLGVLAPSNFARFTYSESLLSGMAKYTLALKTIFGFKLIWGGILLLLILSVFKPKKMYSFLCENIFFVCMIAVNLLFTIFVTLSGVHQLVITNLSLSILLIKLILENSNQRRFIQMKRVLPIVLSCVMLVLYVPIYCYRDKIKVEWEKYKEDIIKSNDGCIVEKKLFLLQKELNSDNFFQDYTNIVFMNVHLSNDKDYRRDLSLMLTDGKRADLLKLVLPDTKDNIIKAGEKIQGNGLYELTGCKCYVLKVNKNLPWEQSTFDTKYKSSSLGRIKQKVFGLLGKRKEKPVVAINIPKYPYDFIAGDYRYVIINLSPDWYSEFKLIAVK